MKILALEFSAPQRSVAVVEAGEGPGRWLEQEEVETGNAPAKPLAMVEEVLRRAGVDRRQIEAVAVGLGPGSYVGIRSAIALAQGWHLGRGVKLAGVGSAEAVVEQAQAENVAGRCAVVIDAQRGEFYLANYELAPGGWHELQALRLASAAAVAECAAAGQLLIGPEVQKWFPHGRTISPRAATVGKLALRSLRWIAGEQLEPVYLRQTSFVKAPPPRILPD